jgi:hypothetical protein
MEIIEINGIKYEKIKKPNVKLSPILQSMLILYGYYKGDKLESIDIVSEYQLIQQKKSKLSRRLRDMIEIRFNKLYKPINNDTQKH